MQRIILCEHISERENKILRTYWTDTEPIVPTAAVPEHIAGIEVRAPRVVRAARVERTRPVVAAAACAEERTVEAVARCGEEDGLVGVARFFTGHLVTIYTVLSCPCPSTLLTQLV